MAPESTSLQDPEKKQRVEALCEEAGFPLAQARREGDVLVLVPETLSALPSADLLQTLSDHIQDLGVRYVAFSVDANP